MVDKNTNTDSVNEANPSAIPSAEIGNITLNAALSGRELDAAVADFVEPKPAPPNQKECAFLLLEPPELSEGRGWLHVHIWEHQDACEWIPRYFSADIAAAMEVVLKMKETRNVEIWAGKNGGGWHVCFEPDSFRRAAAGGPDLPDVICRAALAVAEAT